MNTGDTKDKRKSSVVLYSLSVLAAGAFFFLFKLKNIGPLDFWWWFSGTLIVFLAVITCTVPRFLAMINADVQQQVGKKLLFGVLSAAALYLVFFAGNVLLRSLFTSAGPGISVVYGLGTGQPLIKIAVLLVLVIGPGEELFWRGFIQRGYSQRWGRAPGVVASAVLYTLVHAGSGNMVLILAACIGGFFWGWLYFWKRSIIVNVSSHVIWDVAVFILFPFTR